MRRSRFLATGAAAAASAVALPVRAQFAATPFSQQVSIGVSVPLSGPLQPYGIQLISGVRGAIDEANRMALPQGRVFGIRTFDDQDSVQIAITNAQIAAADPAVIAMVGNLDNTCTLGALAQYANLNMPLIVPTASADAITSQGYRNLLRLPTKDTTQGQLFARTVLSIVKPTNALAVTLDGDYGPAIAQGFVAQAKADRRTADKLSISAANPDFSAAAKAIVDAKADYVFLCGKTATLGPLIPHLQVAGYAGKLGASDGFYGAPALQAYASALEGASIASALPPLDMVASDYMIVSDYTRGYGPFTAFSAYGYAAAQIVISTVGRINSNDRNLLLQALQSGTTYNTLIGPFSFLFSGDPLQPNLYFFSVANGAFKYERAAIPGGFIL